MTDQDRAVLGASQEAGWVLEPDAKALLSRHEIPVPQSVVTRQLDQALAFLQETAGPVVIKAVSPAIVHKTEFNAVVTHVTDPVELEAQMTRLLTLEGCEKVLVEEMVFGTEVFVGSKNDAQFGPVVVLGVGGTAVEVYNDVAIRMAPLTPWDVRSMIDSLKGAQFLTGFRGGAGINLEALVEMVVRFSHLAMALEPNLQTIDLNPVICTPKDCVAEAAHEKT